MLIMANTQVPFSLLKKYIIQLHRPSFLHIMYYMDCKEIFPSPFNPRIHLRYALFKNSSDVKLRIEIFLKFLDHSPSQLYIKKI